MTEVFKKRFQFRGIKSEEASDFIARMLSLWVMEKNPKVPELSGRLPARLVGEFGTILWRPFIDSKGWLHDFSWRQNGVRGIQWHTSVCAYSKSGGHHLEIVVANNGPEITSPAAVLTGRPRLLLNLVEQVEIWGEDCPMDARPSRKTEGEIADFVRYDLLDQNRRFPIILLTSKRDGTFPREFDPAMIAKQCVGLAKVYFTQDEDSTWRLSSHLGGNQLSVFDGAARCYLPGFNRDANPLEHPLIFPGQFHSTAANRLWNWLAANTVQWHTVDAFIEDRRAERDIFESAERIRLQGENRKALHEAKDKDEYKKLAEEYADENSKHLETIELLNQELKDQKFELDALKEKVAFFKSRISDLENTPKNKPDVIPFIPTSVSDVVNNAMAMYSDSIHFCPSALESAKDSPYEDPYRVSEIFNAMDEIAKESRKGGIGQGLKALFAVKRFEYKSGIGEATSKKLRQQYLKSDGERTYECYEHIRLGSTYDPKECLVVYFVSELKNHRFVVGHVGRHMENMTTT